MRNLLVLLLLSTNMLAQPVEGPWTVTDFAPTDSVTSPAIVLESDSTVTLLWMRHSDSGVYLDWLRFSIADSTVLDVTQSLFVDTLRYETIVGAEFRDDGGWAATIFVVDTPWFRIYLVIHDESETNSTLIAEEYHWNFSQPFSRGTWIASPCVSKSSGGRWFIAWLRGWDDNWAGEPHQDPTISLIPDISNPDFRTSGQWLAGNFMWGPGTMSIAALTNDTLFAVLASDNYFFAGPTEAGLAWPDNEWYFGGQSVTVPCVGIPAEVGVRHDGQWLSCSQGDSPSNGIFAAFDASGGCNIVSAFDFVPAPFLTAWQAAFGFAVGQNTPSSIQLLRADTTGAVVSSVGTLYWRDSEHAIMGSTLELRSDGVTLAAWLERADDSPSAMRLRLATVGWETPLAASPKPEVVGSPRDYSLSAYPNPFNSELQIQYMLPHAGHVEVSVRNVLGQKVATLDEGVKSAGVHRAVWSSIEGSGIYFVTLRAEETVKTQKVLLTR